MNREELELLTDIHGFTTLFYMSLRRKSSEWLEWSIKSALRYAMVFLKKSNTSLTTTPNAIPFPNPIDPPNPP